MSQHQAELHKQLWAIANSLRANSGLEPFEFKNYILGIIFYKFLSEKVEDAASKLLEHDGLTYAEAWADEETREALEDELIANEGYFIAPEYLFSNLVKEIKKGSNGKFDTELLQEAVSQIIRSTRGADSEDGFDSLFEDMELSATRLGKDVKTRSGFMATIMNSVNDISFRHEDVEIDVLGDAYEYMISNFAASAGKKAGEFYTPQQVSKILAKIVSQGKEKIKSVYDPTCGSGSLLLRVSKEVNVSKYYGQELTSTTYNLARMNMMLHDVPYDRFDIKNGNTLTEDLHPDMTFEAVLANPPYSANWSPTKETMKDDRFSGYGKLAPASKADFAFVQHMIHHLDEEGTMAVVLPHGVLFRGAAEGVIRKKLIDNNYLHAVIGLPANIFFGTTIPTSILVFKKNRKEDEGILFIDASNGFDKGKNQNTLSDDHVATIIAAYTKRETKDKYSKLVKIEEIAKNDFNLNITRYIDTIEAEVLVDLEALNSSIETVTADIDNLSFRTGLLLQELDHSHKKRILDQEVAQAKIKSLDAISKNYEAPLGSLIINITSYNNQSWVCFRLRGSSNDIANSKLQPMGDEKAFILSESLTAEEKINFVRTVRELLYSKIKIDIATSHFKFDSSLIELTVSLSNGFGESQQ
jgi:type I restriction enzyme M protein